MVGFILDNNGECGWQPWAQHLFGAGIAGGVDYAISTWSPPFLQMPAVWVQQSGNEHRALCCGAPTCHAVSAR